MDQPGAMEQQRGIWVEPDTAAQAATFTAIKFELDESWEADQPLVIQVTRQGRVAAELHIVAGRRLLVDAGGIKVEKLDL